MNTEFKLEAKTREKNAQTCRREDLIPAIVYGKGFDNKKIALDKFSFVKLYKEAGGSNLINLSIDGQSTIKTLVHDIQLDPLRSDILHVDFFKVNMKEKIHAEIPLKFVGDSIAVIEKEGTLITPKTEIEVECLPGDLIPELEVDISSLDDFEKDIRISDLRVAEGIEILDDPEEVVATIEEPRSEEEMAELEEEVKEDVESIEVEHAGEAPAEGEEETSPAEEGKKEEE